jgi:hypothetical protein
MLASRLSPANTHSSDVTAYLRRSASSLKMATPEFPERNGQASDADITPDMVGVSPAPTNKERSIP